MRAGSEFVPGRHINYGVAQFGMSAIAIRHGAPRGLIRSAGPFLTFSDYSRNALRNGGADEIRSIFVFTHDSIGRARWANPPGGRARGESAPDPEHGCVATCDTVRR